jgi:hypothetical protein
MQAKIGFVPAKTIRLQGGTTMIGVASLFSQLLDFIPRRDFDARVREHRADRYAKGFDCWSQFAAMIFLQLSGAQSLREITAGLRSAMGKLVHLGIKSAPCRSTLSYANKHRPWQLPQALFFDLLSRAPLLLGDHPVSPRPFRFKNKLLLLDATTIDLCLSLFPWAKFRQTKGGVKMHALLDHDGYLPVFAHITDAKTHESRVAWDMPLPKGSIVVMDRGYNDYDWFHKLTHDGVFFVTRMKGNAVFEVIRSRPVTPGRILADQEIVLKSGLPLRRVVVWLEDKQEEMVLLTNHLDFAPSTIAAIYKERWQIELFFKAIKQNLKIKTFVGTSKNALLIQIWTALIAILMLKILQLRSRRNWALSTLYRLLNWNLFTYRDLWDWVERADDPPPESPPPQQLALFSGGFGQHLQAQSPVAGG